MSRRTMLLLALLLACSDFAPTLTDSFGHVVADADPLNTELGAASYALGSRIQLRSSHGSRLTSSDSSVLAIERINGRVYEVSALLEGTTTLDYRADGHDGAARVEVRRATSLAITSVAAIRGSRARFRIRGLDGELELGVRGQATANGGDARVWTPERGPDEVWVGVPVDASLDFEVVLETGAGADAFMVSLPTVDESEVASIQIESVDYRTYTARAFNADGEVLLGGTFRWSLDGVDIDVGTTPTNLIRSTDNSHARQLCAELAGARACTETYGDVFEAL